MFSFLTSENSQEFQWNVDMYAGISHIYLLQLWIWIIYCFIDRHDLRAQSGVSSKRQILFILLRSISYLYILDLNPRLSSHMIGVRYSDYISFLIVCGNFPFTYNIGGCWNILESIPYRILLIESSHKWTQILFII